MQEAASRTAEAGECDGGPDAEFLLEDWDSDGGRPGAKRCACMMVVRSRRFKAVGCAQFCLLVEVRSA